MEGKFGCMLCRYEGYSYKYKYTWALLTASEGVLSEQSTTNIFSHSQRLHLLVVNHLDAQYHNISSRPFSSSTGSRLWGLTTAHGTKIAGCARGWVIHSCTRTDALMDQGTHADIETMQYTSMRWFIYSHIIRSSSLLSSSPSRRILVPVDPCSRHNPKQSSKMQLTHV